MHNNSPSILPLLRIICVKLLWIFVVFVGITLVSFFIIHLAPGSPTDLETTMNPLADAEARKKLTAYYGLDKPLIEQYTNWFSQLICLDFGTSMSSDARPVLDKIAQHMPLTIWMNLASLIITLLLAIPIGIHAAVHKGGFFDKATTLLVFIGFAIPSFWLALIVMMHFSIELQWFPLSGLKSYNHDNLSYFQQLLDYARHLALPLIVMTVSSLAGMSRFTRSAMIETLRQDYIITARAKGLTNHMVIYKHALRNALLPLITLLGLSIPGLIGGSVITESIFSLPGMGQLFYSAVMARDYPLIMGNLVLGAVLTLLGNTIADICYGFADPRIRNSSSQGQL